MPHARQQMDPARPAIARQVATFEGRYVSFYLVQEARSHSMMAHTRVPNEDMERRTECAGI